MAVPGAPLPGDMISDDAAPLVTTVIPTFRRPALLRRAVLSALAQSMRRVRVAVYDNASGDGTAAVLAELARADPRVQYHSRSEEHTSELQSPYDLVCR